MSGMIKDAVAIYPHQLFEEHPALKPGRTVYLVEDPLLLAEFPAHRQKLLLIRLSLDAYAQRLESAGHEVIRLQPRDSAEAIAAIAADGVRCLHLAETTDDWLERRLTEAASRNGVRLLRHPSRLFLLPREEACDRYRRSGRHMARFYRSLREDLGILLEKDGRPLGGRWSFDEDNRKPLPRGLALPPDPREIEAPEVEAARAWLESLDANLYGEARAWLPWTHEGAQTWLGSFLDARLKGFGTYEDAITTRSVRLFHSTLSPLMNIGLLTPDQVVDAVLEAGARNNVPINDVEGFVRQVIGWREFIRAAYEVDGREMRRSNFWGNDRALPEGMWTSETGIPPVDQAIRSAVSWGYAHHIERLMVLGNWLLLNRVHPDEVYRWFMALFVDAWDWVMVPNVYGMSEFADGGRFATKPYISGANYIRKMSDHPGGAWEAEWTALYWAFIEDHRNIFEKNPRMSMIPRMLDRMKPDLREAQLLRARRRLSGVASRS